MRAVDYTGRRFAHLLGEQAPAEGRVTCALCIFPCPPHDALKLLDGHVHAACALDATKRLGVRAAVLLKRQIRPSTKGASHA